MENKEYSKWQGIYEDVVIAGGSYVYPIGNGKFRTGYRSEDNEKDKDEKDKKKKEEAKKKEDEKKLISLAKEQEPVWKREGFDNYVAYLLGDKDSNTSDNSDENKKSTEKKEVEEPKGRSNPKIWKNDPADKLIEDRDGNDIPNRIKRQEGQNCSTAIMEYANNITGGDKDRDYYEKQAMEIYNQNIEKEALDPRQMTEMVVANFERSREHESAIRNGSDYKGALDDGYPIMTNLIIPHAEGFDEGTVVTHNVLVVGYTDDNNYIYMDTNRGGLMELGIQNFKNDNWYKYDFVIKNNK